MILYSHFSRQFSRQSVVSGQAKYFLTKAMTVNESTVEDAALSWLGELDYAALLEIAPAESRTFAALRDALLPRMPSGELRVPAATKLVENRA